MIGHNSQRNADDEEVLQRRLWNNSMSKTLRGCSTPAREYIRARIQINLAVINEFREEERRQQRFISNFT